MRYSYRYVESNQSVNPISDMVLLFIQ